MAAGPYLSFILKIGSDPAAMAAFVADHLNDPAAAALSQAQKEALFSGWWDGVEPMLLAENPNVAAEEEAKAGAQIGWNMFRILAGVLLARDSIGSANVTGLPRVPVAP